MATIHGDNIIFQACRTALYDAMIDMQAAMVTDGDEPRPYSVFNTHDQVKMTLPAVTADFVGVIDDGEPRVLGRDAGAGDIVVRYPLLCDIRVHTAYEGGYRDLVKLGRLLNSVNNWIETHRDFSTDIDAGTNVYFQLTEVPEITTDNNFEESMTIGGRMQLILKTTVTHTQV